MVRAIDCWVNVTMGEQKPPEFLLRVKEDYFKGGDEFLKNIEADALIEQMDRAGVEKAVITIDASRPSERALRFAEKHPRRFFYAASLAADRPDARGVGARGAREGAPRGDGARRSLRHRHAAEPRELLPALREVHRARPARLDQHRAAGPAGAGRVPEPAPPRPRVRAAPRAEDLHGARRRSLVGRRHPADDQVPEPAPDDLRLRAEVPAAGAHPLHEHARPGQDPVRIGSSGAVLRAMHPGGAGARSARGRARQVPLRERGAAVLLAAQAEERSVAARKKAAARGGAKKRLTPRSEARGPAASEIAARPERPRARGAREGGARGAAAR